MVDYEAMKKEYPRLKSALTRAKNAGDWRKVLEAADKALTRFETIGFPDNWHLFKVAKEDAEFHLARQGNSF